MNSVAGFIEKNRDWRSDDVFCLCPQCASEGSVCKGDSEITVQTEDELFLGLNNLTISLLGAGQLVQCVRVVAEIVTDSHKQVLVLLFAFTNGEMHGEGLPIFFLASDIAPNANDFSISTVFVVLNVLVMVPGIRLRHQN